MQKWGVVKEPDLMKRWLNWMFEIYLSNAALKALNDLDTRIVVKAKESYSHFEEFSATDKGIRY